MNVLSLFDGMSCGQIALERCGIKVDKYFASEIDKYAIKVSESNYPNIIRLGDVQSINYQMLPNIDLLIGGTPCQGFSLAGKGLNFTDPRSALFFEFVHALRTLKPKYFLLENVKMKKEIQNAISDLVGCQPVEINSALVSAQNRKRLYWTNIPGINQPEDKGILLVNILESGFVDRDKSRCIISSIGRTTKREYFDRKQGQLVRPCEPRQAKKESLCHHVANATDINANESNKRIYAATGKSPTLTTMGGGHREPKISVDVNNLNYRKLTPIECERLQTIPDNYTNHVSNSQRYKMIGNGWTVDIIAHILKGLKI